MGMLDDFEKAFRGCKDSALYLQSSVSLGSFQWLWGRNASHLKSWMRLQSSIISMASSTSATL